MKIELLIGNYKTFLEKIFRNLEKVKIDISELRELDHIAYRVDNSEK